MIGPARLYFIGKGALRPFVARRLSADVIAGAIGLEYAARMKICLHCKMPRQGLTCSTCNDNTPLAPIAALDGYELLGPIGEGGQGRVFSCITHGERRAIKFVDPTRLRDAKARERAARWFKTEVTALKRIEHPHVIKLHAYGDAGPLKFMVTNFVRRTLRVVLDQAAGPLALPRAVGYAAQLADALTYLHDHGIQHRDIKPKNIGVTKDHQIKLFDFGAAGLSTEARQTTVQGGAYSEPYAAPEQLRGEETTYQTDIYSFGAVLFELLTGESHRPQVRTRFKSLSAFYTQPAPPIAQDLPPGLEALIHRCLHPDPNQRVQHTWHLQATLAELADRLDGGFVKTWQDWRDLEAAVPRLKADQARLQTQVDTLSATLAERSQALAETEARIQAATQKASDAEAEAKGFEAAARRARQGFDGADGQLQAKQAEAEDAEARAIAAQQREQDATAAAQQAKAAQQASQAAQRDAEASRQAAQQATAAAERRLAELQQSSTTAEQALATAQRDREAAEAEIEALQAAREQGKGRRMALAAGLLVAGLGAGVGVSHVVDGGDAAPASVASTPQALVKDAPATEAPATEAPATKAPAAPVTQPAPELLTVQMPEGEPVIVEKTPTGWLFKKTLTFESLAVGKDATPWSLAAGTVLRSCNDKPLVAADALKQCATKARKAGKAGVGRLLIGLTTPGGTNETVTVTAY